MIKDKVAVVTGGSRGIGRAVCTEFAKNGANVAFIYAGNTEKAESTLEELKAYGVKAAAYKCDISDAAAVKQAFADITKEFGGIDILVNNAGITRDKLAIMMKPEDFTDVISVNLTGAFNCIRQALPVMLKNKGERKGGKIVNISSVSGVTGNAGQINYSASKAGIIGMTKTVAKEYAAKGICCNAVAPGFVETDMTESFKDNEQILQSIPMKRFARADEVAALCLFLASDSANYITGEVIRIDGGLAT